MYIKKIKNIICDRLCDKLPKRNSCQINIKQHSQKFSPPPDTNDKDDIYEWIKKGIAHFKEWYQPVDFGDGVIAHVTVPPNWNPDPSLYDNNCRGMSKWNYIIKKHIPEVKGKRILDLGCSSGIYSIELARMGAKEIIGIDRNYCIEHRSTKIPPPQDVIEQANFVKKAFELLRNTKYPIKYIAHDIGNLEALNLGSFDFILALAVVYHELDKMPDLIKQLAGMTDHLILQSSQAHGGKLGEYANKINQAKALIDAGFTKIEIDSPVGYPLPVIIGRK